MHKTIQYNVIVFVSFLNFVYFTVFLEVSKIYLKMRQKSIMKCLYNHEKRRFKKFDANNISIVLYLINSCLQMYNTDPYFT